MVGLNTSVNDVRAGTGTAAGVVGVGGGASPLGGQAGQAPGGTGLLGEGVDGHNGILLDVVDLYCF